MHNNPRIIATGLAPDRGNLYNSKTMKTNDALAALSALSQASRLAVFRLLVESGPGGRPVGAIAEELDLPLPTLSFHLRTLRQAGLVRAARQGRSIRYRAEFGTMSELIDYLTANCCQGQPGLCLPDRGAERAG